MTTRMDDDGNEYGAHFGAADATSVPIHQPQHSHQQAPSSSVAMSSSPPFTPCKRRRHASMPARNPQFKMYTSEEKNFFKSLALDDQDRVIQIERRVAELNDAVTPLRFKALCSAMDDHTKALLIKKIDALDETDPSGGEYYKNMTWVDTACRLPVGITKPLPVGPNSPRPVIRAFLAESRSHMDSTVHGHAHAKDQIVRLLAQWVVNPGSRGMVIGIHGPMGVGKTTLIKESVCKVIGLPFALIPLGGASDGSFLDGHSITYEGARWGAVAGALLSCGCMNPVLFFDELDKVSDTERGREVINTLMHLTDHSQNDCFQDKYFADIRLDMSQSLIMFSFNDPDKICPVLRDRMVLLEAAGYSREDKVVIARQHMIPSILRQHAMCNNDIMFSDDVIRDVIAASEKEQGVRNMRRGLESIISHSNLQRLTEGGDGDGGVSGPLQVDSTMVRKCVVGTRDAGRHLSMYT